MTHRCPERIHRQGSPFQNPSNARVMPQKSIAQFLPNPQFTHRFWWGTLFFKAALCRWSCLSIASTSSAWCRANAPRHGPSKQGVTSASSTDTIEVEGTIDGQGETTTQDA